MMTLNIWDGADFALNVPCLKPPQGAEAIDQDIVPFHHGIMRNFPFPLPPDPPPPPVRIGQIYWPCWGLTRYAVGHCLISADNYAAILATGFVAAGRFVQVVMTDGIDDDVTLPMEVASARAWNDPRAEASVDVEEGVSQAWMLTLVDTRFTGIGSHGSSSLSGGTWGNLVIGQINGLGLETQVAADINTILAAESPAYPDPDPDFWGNPYTPGIVLNNAGVADASAAAVNLRIAYAGQDDAFNTLCQVQGPTEAEAAWDAWRADFGSRMRNGGVVQTSAELPWGLYLRFLGSLTNPTDAAANASANPSLATTGAYGYSSAVLNYLTDSGDRADYNARFCDDVKRWMAIDQLDGWFAGYVPVPYSAVPYAVLYDAGRCESRIMRAPVHYPLPLA